MVTTERMLRDEVEGQERMEVEYMTLWIDNHGSIFLLFWSLGLFLLVLVFLIPLDILVFLRYKVLPRLRRMRGE